METLKRKCLLCEEVVTLGPRQGRTLYRLACARLVKRRQVNKSQRRRRALEKQRRGLKVSKFEGLKVSKPSNSQTLKHSNPQTSKAVDHNYMGRKSLTGGQIRQAMICAGLQGVRTLDGIMAAKTKPPHMSDVRWRIELRRRANPGWYDLLPDRPCLPVARPATTADLGFCP